MRKNIFALMAVALLVVGLTACGGYDKYPFKDISEHFLNTAQKIIEKPELSDDEDFYKEFKEKQESLAKDLYGKTILVEISEGLGFEVVLNEGKIGEGEIHGDNLHFPINFDLKITDVDAAFSCINHLCACFYDDEGQAVYAVWSIDDEQELKKTDNGKSDIWEVDSIAEVVDSVEVGSLSVDETPANPYKLGQILHKGLSIGIEFSDIQPFLKISKLVIELMDYKKLNEIDKRNRQLEEEFIRKMREATR